MDYDVDLLTSDTARLSEENHEAMRTMRSDVSDLHAELRIAQGGTSRRNFLIRSGIAASAVTIGGSLIPMSSLWSPAYGAELSDADIAAFAASVEYTAVEVYKAAGASGLVKTPAVGAAATSFAADHTAHAAAFASNSGGKATGKPNTTLLTMLADQLKAAKTENDVLKIAFDTENAAAATYLFALGALKAGAYRDLTASILPIEAGHAATISMVLGIALTDPKAVPKQQTEDGNLSPLIGKP